MNLNKICCIYKIINIKNKKFYLGSTIDYKKRILRHKSDLKKQRHHCIYLQRAYNLIGIEGFSFEIVEICSVDERQKIEQKYLDNWSGLYYNISKTASGGDMISNHPNRKKIIQKRIKLLREHNLKPENIMRNKQNVGSKNPNYGNRWNKEQKAAASVLVKNRWKIKTKQQKEDFSRKKQQEQRLYWDSQKGIEKRKQKSELMKSSKNHFFGKKHSKKTKKILRERMLGKENPNCHKPAIILGVRYKSIHEAAIKLKMNQSTISYRLYSTNPLYKDWNFFGVEKKCIERKTNAVKYRIGAIIYPSLKMACQSLNLSTSALIFRANSKDPKWKDFEFIRE